LLNVKQCTLDLMPIEIGDNWEVWIMRNRTTYQKGHKSKGGRPRNALTLTPLLREALADVHPDTKLTVGRMVVDAMLREAIGGNVRAISEIFNRVDGPPKPDEDRSADAFDSCRRLMDDLRSGIQIPNADPRFEAPEGGNGQAGGNDEGRKWTLGVAKES
jgi:hypothetical protein